MGVIRGRNLGGDHSSFRQEEATRTPWRRAEINWATQNWSATVPLFNHVGPDEKLGERG
tara:strand:+ start:400 stop:576 length:177 start_codon:yes stop_codon:yes gene_type:complete